MDVCQLIAERKIREAMEEGAFDNLEGAGKPLDLSENPFEDPSDRMAHRLLRNNGFAPSWIEEAREIEAESRRLRAQGEVSKTSAQAEGSVVRVLERSDLLERVAALNRRIVSFNLKAPAASLHKPLL